MPPVLSSGNGSRIGRILYRSPDQLRFMIAFFKAAVTDIEFDWMAFLQMNLADMGVVAPSLCNELVIRRQSCEAIGFDPE